MKKLTAGIFATILGLTAMGAADAAVTSKGYVDTAVATAKAAAIADAAKYIDADELEASQTAQNTTIAETYVDKTSYGTDKSALEQSIAGVKATADAAAPQATTYTKDQVDAAIAAVDGATAIEGLQQSIDDINIAQGVQDGKISALETASATHATKDELTTAQNTLQGNIDAVSAVADAAAPQATTYNKTEVDGLISGVTNDSAKYIDADELEASQTAQNTTIAETYVDKTSYGTDKSALEGSIADVKATADAAATQTALQEEATARAEADADLQEAIEAVEGGVEDITGAADNTTTGKYALTKIVTDNGDGTSSVSYGWELIDREYAEADVTANGQ